VGAKNLCVGDAAIYDKHANIVVNLGKARAKDVKSLADILKRRVKERFKIKLEEEVVFLG
ncbi:MAG TPA: UDP-N-acetylenolpyruvoylglucosamine reductase, partial [candidate division Zixibacteria bacterium]